MVINIKLFEDGGGEHRAWVAQCQPGGPDITAQGNTPEEALERLAMTIRAERKLSGRDINQVPTW